MCSLRFFDSTTGTAICARKSWKLDQVEWRREGSWAWRNIVEVPDGMSEIDVSVNSLNEITERFDSTDIDAFSSPIKTLNVVKL
jgi:hypothetical protein